MTGRMLIQIASAVLVAFVATAGPAFAQVDFSGQWGAVNHQDAMNRGPGPDLADYTGLPINEEAKSISLSYTAAVLGMTERGCMFYTENYLLFAPHSIMIERVNDPVTGDIQAWRIGSGGSDRAPLTIWMDGRPAPSPNAPRAFSGFTTGQWQGDRLVATMTHMKRGIMRRNGVPLSDQATMTLHLTRHDNIMTIMGIIDDPIYLEEKLVLTGSYRLNPRGNAPATNPTCFPFTELPVYDEAGKVPHFLPGTNHDADTYAKLYGLPLEAAYGGAATIYPEYRKQLQTTYAPPASCTRYCCGGGGFNAQASGITCKTR